MTARASQAADRAAGEAARPAIPPAGPRRVGGRHRTARIPSRCSRSQATTRIPELVPVRYGRMAVSPFTFLRGAALPMAADLSRGPELGRRRRSCAATPTSPTSACSPRRSATCCSTSTTSTRPCTGRSSSTSSAWPPASSSPGAAAASPPTTTGTSSIGRSARTATGWRATRRCGRSTSTTPASTSTGDPGLRRQARARDDRGHGQVHRPPRRRPRAAQADDRRRTARGASSEHPPTLVRPRGRHPAARRCGARRRTARPSRRTGASCSTATRSTDYALKVVGVGSVGLGAFIALFMGEGRRRPAVPPGQAGRGRRSTSATSGRAAPASHGERVVTGQRRLQAASDILLGWAVGRAGAPLVRPPAPGPEGQRRHRDDDRRGPRDLGRAVRLGAGARARALRAAGDDRRLPRDRRRVRARDGATFAEAYADQTERDHAALTAAIAARPDHGRERRLIRRARASPGLRLSGRGRPAPAGSAC